jgi:hypothetical protein
LVGGIGSIGGALVLVTGGVLGDVAVVVSLHLVEEDLYIKKNVSLYF